MKLNRIEDNKGFGLVECVIAMFLLWVVLLGIAGHVGVSMAALQTGKMTSVASSLLQDKAEAIRHTPYPNVATGNDSITKGGIHYTRNWVVSTNGNMKTAALSIAWSGRMMSTSVLITQ